MLLEMHCHTSEHSACSHVGARELVRRVFEKGLQGIVLTDHHYLWPQEELTRLRRDCRIPEHFLILSGQETRTSDLGDVLVYGAEETFAAGTSLRRIREQAPLAALVWAHPYRRQHLPGVDTLLHPALDGVEIFNSNQTVRENSRGLQDWHRHRFTAIAGTDTHSGSYAGLYPTLFDHPVETMEELAGEIRQGRCRPFLKEIPKAGARHQVTEIIIGAKGQDEYRQRLIIKTLQHEHGWQTAERAHLLLETLAGHGFSDGPFRVPKAIDENPRTMTLIQQGLRGKSLFEKILSASPADRRHYLELSGRWLARLHNCRLRISPVDEFWWREQQRLDHYLSHFTGINHPHSRRALEIKDLVLQREERILARHSQLSIQGHGDFHPKNIIIGQDRVDNRDTLFIAAIDFESSYVMPAAFDVGTFLGQYRNQLFDYADILQSLPEEIFLDAYLRERDTPLPDADDQIATYRARTNLSIAAYLIKLGLGDSENLWRVLLEAEQALSTT